jgi:hypothetical protein
MLMKGRLHKKHVLQREILVPTERLLCDPRKLQKTLNTSSSSPSSLLLIPLLLLILLLLLLQALQLQ